jgi:subtilisin family serine protease
MKSFWLSCILAFAVVAAEPAFSETRIIVRDTVGPLALQRACTLLGCYVVQGLSDPDDQLFVVTIPDASDPALVITQLLALPEVAGAEIDQQVHLQEATAGTPPDALFDRTPMDYYGTTVRHGYVYQPANQIVRTLETQGHFGIAGSGVVADIDTGVDTTHPVLQAVIVPGYDFVHNTDSADEKNDFPASSQTGSGEDTGQPAQVNQSTEALLDQSTEAVLDGNAQFAAFGHGTMTAGVIHLVAPQANIMPLKAFSADGSGFASDVLRAIYYAADHNANVLNMSFDFSDSSPELKQAIDYANNRGIICVAAVGNNGIHTMVYPAGLSQVMGIASTDNNDVRSTFSNYGPNLVWVAAPGEGIVTTYPFGYYAATWGTSFSTPFVAGTAALLLSVSPLVDESIAQSAISNAQALGDPMLRKRRLDTYQSVNSLWSPPLANRLLHMPHK